MQEKKYLKQSIKNGLHWHTDVWDIHISLRFAGKPKFVLEEFQSFYWEKEWLERYKELIIILKKIWDNNFSPFVIYINNRT